MQQSDSGAPVIHNALSFVAVVKAGGFSNAAKIIGISKAQLSRHVSQLETSLGIQLLYRTTRSIALTESGKEFFLNCSDIEESYNEAVDQLKQDFYALRGTLRITAPISFGSEFLPKLIYQFNQKYPNIKIILSLTSSTEDLIEKNFDLAIRVAQSLPDSNFRMRTLMTLQMVLCAAPSYLKNHITPNKLEDLENHKCITSINRDIGLSKIHWPFYKKGKIIKFAPNSITEVDSLRAQIHLILLGAGIGRVPYIFVKKEIEQGRLIHLLPAIEQPKSYVYLLFTNRKNLPKKIQIFIDFIKEFDNEVVHETLLL
ncbi:MULTISPECIES: LysR family transcriptional regulator [Legionella]|uniref:LysR family transcriptional regulator n=1 Tax=Legionella drozanskii LLAP-1 TaxID=1212489 RepID=A0A0W0TBB2_9GAMM|nr:MULTISPECIES: LysR family transcriptional regulator [Legionella]KTC92857.1 LysR family transcriptional regulator [Legionella drozanskii LLAP-1]PJE05720.1 MAG: LysR family transcriptional regulator [Legionella sp.]